MKGGTKGVSIYVCAMETKGETEDSRQIVEFSTLSASPMPRCDEMPLMELQIQSVTKYRPRNQ